MKIISIMIAYTVILHTHREVNCKVPAYILRVAHLQYGLFY